MSKCSCAGDGDGDGDGIDVRVSDEDIYRIGNGDGTGEFVRLRCMNCGGKAGFLPVDALEHVGTGGDADPDPELGADQLAQFAEPGDYDTIRIRIERLGYADRFGEPPADDSNTDP